MYPKAKTERDVTWRRGRAARALVAGAALGVCALAWWLYARHVSVTKIAFVNFQDFQFVLFQEADAGPFVRTERVTISDDKTPRFGAYDAVFLFGMGLRLTDLQRTALVKAAAGGTAIHVYGTTAGEAMLSNLDPAHRQLVDMYLGYGGLVNARRLLVFTRSELDGKRAFVPAPEPPYRVPAEAYFHLGEEEFFETHAEYQRFYERTRRYRPGAARVAVLAGNVGPHSPSTARPIRALVEEMERVGLNVYPVTGFHQRLDRLREIGPDVVVFVAHGGIAPGRPGEAAQLLGQLNAPVLCPVVLFEPYDTWIAAQKGMGGGMLGQNVVVPEVDRGRTLRDRCPVPEQEGPHGVPGTARQNFDVLSPRAERVSAAPNREPG